MTLHCQLGEPNRVLFLCINCSVNTTFRLYTIEFEMYTFRISKKKIIENNFRKILFPHYFHRILILHTKSRKNHDLFLAQKPNLEMTTISIGTSHRSMVDERKDSIICIVEGRGNAQGEIGMY